jgi:hypothetical protein
MLRIVCFDSKRVYFPRYFECVDVIDSIFLSPDAYLAAPKLLTPYWKN